MVYIYTLFKVFIAYSQATRQGLVCPCWILCTSVMMFSREDNLGRLSAFHSLVWKRVTSKGLESLYIKTSHYTNGHSRTIIHSTDVHVNMLTSSCLYSLLPEGTVLFGALLCPFGPFLYNITLYARHIVRSIRICNAFILVL